MNRRLAALAARFPLINELLTTRLKQTLAAGAALFIAIAAVTYADLVLTSEDLFTKAGPIIGGDFIVFNHAAKAAGAPDMIAIYEMSALKAQLQAAYPGKGDFNFAWMYPPTMSLIISPFAAPPYLVSFTLWVAVFAGAFFFTLSRLWADKWALFFAAASPAVFQGAVTGQNGFLTATLVALAGAFLAGLMGSETPSASMASATVQLTWREFAALPQQEVTADMHCVTRWSRFDVKWRGVLARDVLALAQVKPEAKYVMVHAEHGFTSNVPLEDLLRPTSLFATHHEGEPLPADHGYPLRLVVPHLYAWKSVKWVRGLELLTKDEGGFWEQGGYHMYGDPFREQRFSRDQ